MSSDDPSHIHNRFENKIVSSNCLWLMLFWNSLFFSFSSLAGDDLTGKAVYCYKEYDTPIAASAFGIKFVSKNEAIFYFERNQKPLEML